MQEDIGSGMLKRTILLFKDSGEKHYIKKNKYDQELILILMSKKKHKFQFILTNEALIVSIRLIQPIYPSNQQ